MEFFCVFEMEKQVKMPICMVKNNIKFYKLICFTNLLHIGILAKLLTSPSQKFEFCFFFQNSLDNSITMEY